MKDTVRISFDVPVQKHITYKTESVKSRIPVKDFMNYLVELGYKEYQKSQLDQSLTEGIRQAKEGKSRVISQAEIDRWFEMVEEND